MTSSVGTDQVLLRILSLMSVRVSLDQTRQGEQTAFGAPSQLLRRKLCGQDSSAAVRVHSNVEVIQPRFAARLVSGVRQGSRNGMCTLSHSVHFATKTTNRFFPNWNWQAKLCDVETVDLHILFLLPCIGQFAFS